LNIISLYKIWRGNEFLIESIESNYFHVDAMVFVSSDVSWNGETGNNTEQLVLEWKATNDHRDKIHIVHRHTTDQAEQYKAGLEYIRTLPQCDWIQIVDSDEVWDETAWMNAITHLHCFGRRYNAFACTMQTFIKSREFLIDESEACVRPTVFVKAGSPYVGCRFNGVLPCYKMQSVQIDHYSLVRDSWEDVLKKITTSQRGDGQRTLVNMEDWKRRVWDKIPDGEHYHPYPECANIWKGFKRVEAQDGH